MSETPSSQTRYDVIVIGAGPAGLSAALYAARADLSTLVIDKGIKAGALGKTPKISNYPGIARTMTGEELLQLMRDHAIQAGATVTESRVSHLHCTQDTQLISLVSGETLHTRATIIATGAMGRVATLPGERELHGKGLGLSAREDIDQLRDKRVFVYGGTEEAAMDVTAVAEVASVVQYAYAKRELDVSAAVDERLNALSNVERLPRHRLMSIHGTECVAAVEVRTPDRTMVQMAADACYIYTGGGAPIVDFLPNDIAINTQGGVTVDADMATNIAGVFACGDVIVNQVQQAVVAAGQGCIAGLSADKLLNARPKHARDYD